MNEPRQQADPPGDHIGDETAVEFLDGSLSAREVRRVEAHAARCDTCRQLLAELGRADSHDDQVPTTPLGRDAHTTLDSGDKVGRFEVLSRIGSGGMGVVFAAYDRRLNRKVALKLLRNPGDGASTESAQMRLMREAQAMAKLSHPNVISVYDVGTYKSEVYIAMEFVEGETLSRWLRRWRRPWRDILDKFLLAGAALAEAHAEGLVHRDFKPDNVLVGSDERVRVMDFGLARSLLFDPPAADLVSPSDGAHGAAQPERAAPANMLGHALTKTGAQVGTPRYMAPEQFAGRETDARTDQFSFCVAMYEAFYRAYPFPGDTALGLEPDARPLPPPPGTEVPAWLHDAIVRGLSVAAQDRFPSMQALLRAVTPAPAPPRRIRFAIASALAGLGLIATAAAVPALLDARDASDRLGGRAAAAEARVAELERERDRLQGRIDTIQREGDDREALIHDLQRRLDEASRQLEQAEAALSEREAPRAGAQSPPSRPPRPRLHGLSPDQLMAPLSPLRHDLGTCLREWLERRPSERMLLGLRLEIDPAGTPALGKIRGIDDRVVRACVGDNLLRLSFPTADAITVADFKFFGTPDTTLKMAAEVIDLRPTPADAGPSP
ncbi:protein kinase domain-containing protein [Haliangium sp.]|uniref:protein kinase domain-containing protein n=1 Tax=Haliangium sp. TaxID=2663208 RepID=UPI003D0A3FDA